jgi:hypothetical protein
LKPSTDRLSRIAHWLVIKATFCALVWAWIAHQNQGALNVAVAMAWLYALLSVHHLSGPGQAALRARGRPALPMGLALLVDVAIAAALVYHGAWFTALAVLLAAWFWQAGWHAALQRVPSAEEQDA